MTVYIIAKIGKEETLGTVIREILGVFSKREEAESWVNTRRDCLILKFEVV